MTSRTSMNPRNPKAEASELAGPGLTAHVLEPSPPAVTEEPFFADDPATPEPTSDGSRTVTPTSAGDMTWDDLVESRPELAEFAADHWLGARRGLPAVPSGYPAARDGFHRLGYSVVAEARRASNSKFGLRYTHGGFGTPFFGDDEQVRVEGNSIVVQRGSSVETATITSIAAAAAFAGVEPTTVAAEHDSPELGDINADLGTTEEAGRFLGEWYGFSWAVIEELRLTPGAVDVERTQLWPGHFDAAIAMGDAEAGKRATFGMSPGDASHDEPYIYVAAWGDVDRSDPYWNETNFNGASLDYSALLAADDAYATALEFVRGGYQRLNS